VENSSELMVGKKKDGARDTLGGTHGGNDEAILEISNNMTNKEIQYKCKRKKKEIRIEE
jgi:hypothetical protein